MFEEVTITGLREAYASGTRCTEVVHWHLDRLEAADPVLHFIQALVPDALDRASWRPSPSRRRRSPIRWT